MVNMKNFALVMLLITLPYLMGMGGAMGPEGRCGGRYGGCPSGLCCSPFGYCGRGYAYGCPIEISTSPVEAANSEGRCGGSYGGCPVGQCCSAFGFCGKNSPFCPYQSQDQAEAAQAPDAYFEAIQAQAQSRDQVKPNHAGAP